MTLKTSIIKKLQPSRNRVLITFLSLILISFTFSAPHAATINVPDDQPTIQAGIDAAFEGDTVLIAPGTYTGDGNWDVSFLGKDIVVKSDGDTVAVDAYDPVEEEYHRGFLFINGETSDAILQGITITNAYVDTGSGVLVNGASPSIKDCWFYKCGEQSSWPYDIVNAGAGAACLGGSGATFTNCRFEQCNAQSGGGVFIRASSEVSIMDCDFENCYGGEARLANYLGSGPAVYVQNSNPTITGCRILNNTMGYFQLGTFGSAGIMLVDASPTISYCTFAGNEARDDLLFGAAALWVRGGAPTITNCTFYDNRTLNNRNRNASLCITLENSAALISHCLIAFNKARFPSSYYETSTIVWHIDTLNPQSPTIEYNIIYGNTDGDFSNQLVPLRDVNGNLQLDPRFCDTAASNFHLASNSWASPDNNPCGELIGAWPVDSTCPIVACCVGRRGNVDNSPDDLMSIGDLTKLIDILFISLLPPNCWEEANLDESQPEGEGSLSLGDLTALIDYLFITLEQPPPCP